MHPNVIAPPAMVATISQPLCRKNGRVLLVVNRRIVSVFAVDMSVGQYETETARESELKSGRTPWAHLDTAPNATESERGCVVPDQPQHVKNVRKHQVYSSNRLLRSCCGWSFDTAALRGSARMRPDTVSASKPNQEMGRRHAVPPA